MQVSKNEEEKGKCWNKIPVTIKKSRETSENIKKQSEKSIKEIDKMWRKRGKRKRGWLMEVKRKRPWKKTKA